MKRSKVTGQSDRPYSWVFVTRRLSDMSDKGLNCGKTGHDRRGERWNKEALPGAGEGMMSYASDWTISAGKKAYLTAPPLR